MGVAALADPSLTGEGRTLGAELLALSTQQGLQIGAFLGLGAGPVAWLATGRRRPLYTELLPRAGALGLASGCAVGAASVVLAAAMQPAAELQLQATRAAQD